MKNIQVTEETPGQVFKNLVKLKLKDGSAEWKDLDAHLLGVKYTLAEKGFYLKYLPRFQECLNKPTI